MENATMRMNKAFYVTINSKGGVGKTTTATQVLAPFFYDKMNKGNLPTKESRLPVVYEIDDENNSQQAISNTTIFTSGLVKNPKNGLQEILIKEVSNFERNYPVILDVGVAAFSEALNTISSVLEEEDIVFVVPTKPDEVDAQNTAQTVINIKEVFKGANIIFALSDSQWRAGEEEEIKKEFGILFGEWYKMDTLTTCKSLFSTLNLKEEDGYIHIPRDDVFAQAKFSERKTVYELSLLARKADKGELERVSQGEYTKLIAEAQAKNDTKAMNRLIAEKEKALRINTLRARCKNYYNHSLSGVFTSLEKILSSKVFV